MKAKKYCILGVVAFCLVGLLAAKVLSSTEPNSFTPEDIEFLKEFRARTEKIQGIMQEKRISTLRGSKEEVATVRILGTTNLDFAPADEKFLQSSVENKLRKAGLKVQNDRGSDRVGIGLFKISVLVTQITAHSPLMATLEGEHLTGNNWLRIKPMLIKEARRKEGAEPIYIVSTSAELIQEVALVRNPDIHTMAVTWTVGHNQDINEKNLNYIVRDKVMSYTSFFINDYLAANPIQPSTKNNKGEKQ